MQLAKYIKKYMWRDRAGEGINDLNNVNKMAPRWDLLKLTDEVLPSFVADNIRETFKMYETEKIEITNLFSQCNQVLTKCGVSSDSRF